MLTEEQVAAVRWTARHAGADAVEFIGETENSPSQVKFRYGTYWELWKVEI